MSVLQYILAGLFILEGVFSLVTGKSIGSARNMAQIEAKYDMISYARWARITGGAFALFGVVFLVVGLGKDGILPFEVPIWLFITIFALIVVAVILATVLVLKKVGQGPEVKQGAKGQAAKKQPSEEKYIDED